MKEHDNTTTMIMTKEREEKHRDKRKTTIMNEITPASSEYNKNHEH